MNYMWQVATLLDSVGKGYIPKLWGFIFSWAIRSMKEFNATGIK